MTATHNRHFWHLVLSFLLLSFTSPVWAAGLGEITLNSKLNQPLSAMVLINDLKPFTLNEAVVSLGGVDVYESLGLHKDLQQQDFTLELIEQAGKPVIKLSSHRSITEPMIDLVIELRTPQGRVMRSYTLLFDLPDFD